MRHFTADRFEDPVHKEVKPVKEQPVKKLNTRALVTSGVFIAVAFILSYLKLFSMPQGGSVTFASMLPMLLIGLLYGPGWGIGAGTCLRPFAVFAGRLRADPV